MKLSHLIFSLGCVLTLLCSSCGKLSPGLQTNYGRVIASGESDDSLGFSRR